MSKLYKINYIKTAVDDLEEIIIYISENDKLCVNNLIDVLDNGISQLTAFPFIGKIYNNAKLSNEYHMIIIEDYLVFYKVNGDIVEIYRIIHCKRNYKRLI